MGWGGEVKVEEGGGEGKGRGEEGGKGRRRRKNEFNEFCFYERLILNTIHPHPPLLSYGIFLRRGGGFFFRRWWDGDGFLRLVGEGRGGMGVI